MAGLAIHFLEAVTMETSLPQSLVDLLNKVEPDRLVFCHMVPTRIFRVSVNKEFKTFRVEQLTITNKDRMNPHGSWHTLSTHGSETPGVMLSKAMETAIVAQKDFIIKMTNCLKPPKIIRATP